MDPDPVGSEIFSRPDPDSLPEEPDPGRLSEEPDPDPYQNVSDPEHLFRHLPYPYGTVPDRILQKV